MKYSRHMVRCKAHAVPVIKFERQVLTSFSGLVIFQELFARLQLAKRLARCFTDQASGSIYKRATLFLQLIVHMLLGYRQLRDVCYYRDDPLVKRLLGLRRLPDVSTLSRVLNQMDEVSVTNLRQLLRQMVMDRLRQLALVRITLDFDGCVQSTKRHAEGTAVGFNKRKKGARSYYPLFCTIAQTGQVLDFLHRPGNVHDSHGARQFILACIQAIRYALPGVVIEVRMDSAFFSDEIVMALDQQEIQFSITVPFQRFVSLKDKIESRKRWLRLARDQWYFEQLWKPDCWPYPFRFVFVRTRVQRQNKEPVQLELFTPHEFGYDFKVIVTNKTVAARWIVAFHDGRGSQEGIFAELKTQCHMNYVPVRRRLGNQTYLLAGLFAHNLMRELQMLTATPSRRTTPKRTALWVFEALHTFRQGILQRAGRLTRPSGILTLTISAPHWLKSRLLAILKILQNAP
ncbi:MAG: hypothetical protein KatS3mg109_1875 [Pirellulaceae bacterium]|nr:MAG: hypothetical protein KatS3mg109_1059 [Pirellulaceae bacterium]GIW91443.1 MAG: hypothetical protein KatS3mg109_1875 [Pirellulaceae bacterium]